MSVRLLATQTGAGDSSEFRIRGGNTGDIVTIMAQPAIVSAEECDLEQSVNGTNWHKVTIGALSASIFAFTVSNPGVINATVIGHYESLD